MRLSISSKARRRTWRGGIALFVLTCVAAAASAAAPRPWLDVSASFEQRAAALVAQMTLEEKAAQMQNAAPAIERLGYPPTTGGTRDCTASHGQGRPRCFRRQSAWPRPSMYR